MKVESEVNKSSWQVFKHATKVEQRISERIVDKDMCVDFNEGIISRATTTPFSKGLGKVSRSGVWCRGTMTNHENEVIC